MHMKSRYGRWRMMRFIPFALLMITLAGALVMQLWNWLLPDLFGLHSISLIQALGLLVLSRILLGGWFRPGGHRCLHHGAWNHMTDEERERIREKLRGRCWHSDEHDHKLDGKPDGDHSAS